MDEHRLDADEGWAHADRGDLYGVVALLIGRIDGYARGFQVIWLPWWGGYPLSRWSFRAQRPVAGRVRLPKAAAG
jgi:hypothetical protein